LNNSLGGLVVKNAGYVNLVSMLDTWKSYLISQNRYLKAEIDINAIEVGETIKNDDFECNKLVFCEGYKGKYNPFFSYLPFQFSKGEVLEIAVKNISANYIINGGVFILPLKNGNLKVGSTYFWDDETELPTKRGLDELTEKLDKMLLSKYEITQHRAGIRPTVNDRKPFLGFHPKHKNIAIFNGLGTKGVMLAPFFANHFCEHIENSTNLLKEVDIQRYANLYTF
jgi:glycine/D-amino acid oxidase-like deaminating enzyme